MDDPYLNGQKELSRNQAAILNSPRGNETRSTFKNDPKMYVEDSEMIDIDDQDMEGSDTQRYNREMEQKKKLMQQSVLQNQS